MADAGNIRGVDYTAPESTHWVGQILVSPEAFNKGGEHVIRHFFAEVEVLKAELVLEILRREQADG